MPAPVCPKLGTVISLIVKLLTITTKYSIKHSYKTWHGNCNYLRSGDTPHLRSGDTPLQDGRAF